MGQTSSSISLSAQTDTPEQESAPSVPEQQVQNTSRRRLRRRSHRPFSIVGDEHSSHLDSSASRPLATFSRQVSSHSIPIAGSRANRTHDFSSRDDIILESHERRSSRSFDDSNIHSSPVTHITASPSRRRSIATRISSGFLAPHVPRIVSNDSQSLTEGDSVFGRSVSIQAGAVRRPFFRSFSSPATDSLTGHLLPGWLQRRRTRTRISAPMPLIRDEDQSEHATTVPAFPDIDTPMSNGEASLNLARSFSSNNAGSEAPTSLGNGTSPDNLTPSQPMDTSWGSESSSEPASEARRGTGENHGTSDAELPWILRTLASAISSRFSRPSDTNSVSRPNGEEGGEEEAEDGLHQLLRGIQRAVIPRDGASDSAGAGRSGNAPVDDLLRIFRLNGPSMLPLNNLSLQRARDGGDSQHNESGRSSDETPDASTARQEPNIAIIVMVVRSVPSDTPRRRFLNESSESRPNSPWRVNSTPIRSHDSLIQNLDESSTHTTTSRRHLRRTSSTHEENQISSTSRPTTPLTPRPQSQTAASSPFNAQSPQDYSPPGPFPPPSTPAEHNLHGTLNFRSNLVRHLTRMPLQALQASSSPVEEEGSDAETPSRPHVPATPYRRRSESEAARYRSFGSGDVRRNGMVEPDDADDDDNARRPSGTVYVIGAVMSEGQQFMSAPSLFTDNPTYEDMLLLSSLLGPVKPPVASSEDLEAAGGTFKVSTLINGERIAVELATQAENQPNRHIAVKDRCLVCLEDYLDGEHIRQLGKCSHFFHQTCIDQWLTNGRNSCPLCREQGVFRQT